MPTITLTEKERRCLDVAQTFGIYATTGKTEDNTCVFHHSVIASLLRKGLLRARNFRCAPYVLTTAGKAWLIAASASPAGEKGQQG